MYRFITCQEHEQSLEGRELLENAKEVLSSDHSHALTVEGLLSTARERIWESMFMCEKCKSQVETLLDSQKGVIRQLDRRYAYRNQYLTSAKAVSTESARERLTQKDHCK